MDNHEEIIRRLEALEKERKPEESKRSLFDYFEKLLLPLVLGVLTVVVSLGAQKISKSQLALATAQERRQREETQTAIQLKYLELIYKDITDPKQPTSQLAALSFLYVVKPAVGAMLARAVAVNTSNSADVRQQAEELGKQIEMFGPLFNYKVVFYCREGDHSSCIWTSFYEKKLRERGFKNTERKKATTEELKEKGPPKGFEIRHDDYYEKDAADRLFVLLTEINADANRNVPLRKVATGRGRTPFVLTVFVNADGK